MGTDYRREWIKNRITTFFGLPSCDYFEEMMTNKEELEEQFSSFLDDTVDTNERKAFFFLYKTSYEKLVDEEILVPQKGKTEVFKADKSDVIRTTHSRKLPDSRLRDGILIESSIYELQYAYRVGVYRNGTAPSCSEGGVVIKEILPEPTPEPKKKGKKGKGKEKKKKKGKWKSETNTPVSGDETEGGIQLSENYVVQTEIENLDTKIISEDRQDTVDTSLTVSGSEPPLTETEASTLQTPEITDADTTDVDDIPTDIEDGKKKKKKKKDKGKKQKKKKKDGTPQIASEEDEYIMVPQIIQKTVVDYILHGGFMNTGEKMFESDNYRIIYFYRKTDSGIPRFKQASDADIEMPYYFLVGSSTGNFLHTVTHLCSQMFTPLIKGCFEEPALKASKETGNEDRGTRVSSDFRRPSDYRRISMYVSKVQRTQEDTEYEIPEDRQDNNLSTPIKDELFREVSNIVQSFEW
ncbi:unnamed protein product [Diabrotica balteata]|uniref:Uncharacterized protein n=1 Tax=Diabrotica balteata TaxID=107213 RepID=A0A9P0GXQ0_DIABA|nr:unnamed protein product [Diabrotica balteata]